MDFREHATQCLESIQHSVTRLIHEAGADSERPQDLARALSIDKSLAWKITRLRESPDPFGAIDHLVGRQGLEIFFKAAARSGASQDAIARCRSCCDEFENLVAVQAGDRSTLKAMASGFSREAFNRSSRQMLRQFYQAATYIWGIQASLRLAVRVLAPSVSSEDYLDVAKIDGYTRLRRLRENSRCHIGQWSHWKRDLPSTDLYSDRWIAEALPLDPRIATGQVPLLPDFCSHPLPEIEQRRDTSGELRYVLSGSSVGARSLADVVIGSVARATFERYAQDGPSYGNWLVAVDTPVETLHFDALIHRDLLPWMRPIPMLHSVLRADEMPPGRTMPGEQLRLPASIEQIGPASDAGNTAEMPRYADMLSAALGHLAWDPADFEVFRLSFRHPPVATMVRMKMPLCPPPAAGG